MLSLTEQVHFKGCISRCHVVTQVNHSVLVKPESFHQYICHMVGQLISNCVVTDLDSGQCLWVNIKHGACCKRWTKNVRSCGNSFIPSLSTTQKKKIVWIFLHYPPSSSYSSLQTKRRRMRLLWVFVHIASLQSLFQVVRIWFHLIPFCMYTSCCPGKWDCEYVQLCKKMSLRSTNKLCKYCVLYPSSCCIKIHAEFTSLGLFCIYLT